MDPHFHSFLCKIGFSQKAVAVYLALLYLCSPQPVQVIARKAHLNRSTTYYVLNELLRNGFVSRFFKGQIQYFSALAPDFLEHFLEQKQRNLQKYLQEFRVLRSQFKDFSPSSRFSSATPRIEYLEGSQSFSVIFHRVFKNASFFCIYRPLEYWMRTTFFDCIEKQVRDVFEKNSFHQRFFFPDTQQSRDFLKRIHPKPHSLNFSLFPNASSFFEHECLIYDDCVSFLSFHQKNIFSVTFQDHSFASFQRHLFDSFWNLYNRHNDFS